jgi:hypothetical protein
MKLYIFADKEILEVREFNGANIFVSDGKGWTNVIPITRVERFCDKDGNHINYKL